MFWQFVRDVIKGCGVRPVVCIPDLRCYAPYVDLLELIYEAGGDLIERHSTWITFCKTLCYEMAFSCIDVGNVHLSWDLIGVPQELRRRY